MRLLVLHGNHYTCMRDSGAEGRHNTRTHHRYLEPEHIPCNLHPCTHPPFHPLTLLITHCVRRLCSARQQRGLLARQVDELQEQAVLQRQVDNTWLQVQGQLYREEGSLREQYEELVDRAKVGSWQLLLLLATEGCQTRLVPVQVAVGGVHVYACLQFRCVACNTS